MKALIVTPGKNNSARIKDISKPKPKRNQYLIKTVQVGIDGTDREINNGKYGTPPKNESYLILGHEALGKVVEKGNGLQDSTNQINVGDFVVPTVRRPDNCYYCQTGEPDMCIRGNYTEHGIKGAHGYLREYFTEIEDYLIQIPTELSDTAVLLEPLSVIEKGVRQGWKIQERMNWDPKTALVLGLGSIGILGSLVLKIKGLNVFVYSQEDKSNPKIDLINKMGINYISASEVELEDLNDYIDANLDFILEATGNSIVAINSMSLVGQNGVLCLTGVTGGHKEVTLCADCLNLDLVLGNKLIFGTVNANRVDFERGVKDIKYLQKKFPGILDNIITHRYSLEEFDKVLKDFEGLKALIEF